VLLPSGLSAALVLIALVGLIVGVLNHFIFTSPETLQKVAVPQASSVPNLLSVS
jgi:hypothetical protein